MGWKGPKLKLRTAHESVGWLNSVGPLAIGPCPYECDNPECGCHEAIKKYKEQLDSHQRKLNVDQ